MNYELAKKLQDAGFPQNWSAGKAFYDDQKQLMEPILRTPATLTEFTHGTSIPTLEELIEACSGRCEEISNHKHSGEKLWAACAYPCEECGWEGLFIERGATPTEAVARLWLALNKDIKSEDA